MITGRILVVDDVPEMLDVCRDMLSNLGAEVVTECDADQAVRRLESEPFDLAIVDIRMPGQDGLSVLRRARAANPSIAVLLMSAFPTEESVEQSVKLGASGYITKPITPDQLRTAATRALLTQRLGGISPAPENTTFFEGMFGRCEAMRRVYALIERMARADVDILVMGESGTGKELVARALHARGPRAQGHFVPIDCGAIPENLLESELFGHEKGAYTGAVNAQRGLIEFAHQGTIFLDEVAELPLSLQAKLLRVVQERQYKRVGGAEYVGVDARIIAATNRDIDREVREGRFREDLFYRLNVVRIEIPPLRERREDVVSMFEYFVQREAPRFERVITEIEPAVRLALERYSWPGNVREMLNVVRRTLALGGGEHVLLRDLPGDLVEQPRDGARGFFAQRETLLRSFEQRYLSELLARHNGDVAAAAVEAGIPRGTFYRLMKKYGLRSQPH
ncbi:MAG: sigma-54-dependent Fis family transcriptional regulator [Planctomycetes bacterium]|nr:sigma-54-dependent Fis family transcriptional regulator [Planctomycetota bacterium]